MDSKDVARGAGLALILALLQWSAAGVAMAGERPAFAAREGLGLAEAAALRWAPDAQLVYVENDEAALADGRAGRWGYLFRSESLGRSRAYSVRDGRILVAEDLVMRFEAPPLQTSWIDSGDAIRVADREAGDAYRRRHGGSARTLLLMRGAFQDADPDAPTWTVVYTSPSAPALFVMVDARDARVRRTWRG